MSNRDYWEERAREQEELVDEITEEELERLKDTLNNCQKDLAKEMQKIYAKYAKDNKVSYEDAIKYLTDDEREEFQRDLSFYIEKYHDSEYVKANKQYLHALSVRARVKRIEEIKAEIKKVSNTLHTALNTTSRQALSNVMQEVYMHTAYSYSNGGDIKVITPSAKQFDELMKRPWSGSNYSDKIWDVTNGFEDKLSKIINAGMMQGKSYTEMAKDLRQAALGKDGTGGTVYECERLIRTEAAYIQGQANLKLYKEAGVEQYEFLATLDMKTSKVCQELDGKKFNLEDARVGVNYKPMHPNCRSTVLPVVEWADEEPEEVRMMRDENGRNKIIDKISYEEWLEKYGHETKRFTEKDYELLDTEGLVEELDKNGLNEAEIRSVNNYVSSYAYKINGKLRNHDALTKDERDYVRNLDSALNKLPPFEGIVDRTLQFMFKEDLDQFVNMHIIGETIKYKQYISATNGEETHIEEWNVRIKIISKHGRNVQDYRKNEGEILFQRNAGFKVLYVKIKEEKVFILLEEE